VQFAVQRWWFSQALTYWLPYDGQLAALLPTFNLPLATLMAPTRFQFISGSATGIDKNALTRGLTPGSNFYATVIPDKVVWQCLLHSLGLVDQEGTLTTPIAVVGESNTSYGDNLRNHVRHHVNNGANLVYLPFPLQISNVRVAYAKSRAEGPNAAPVVPSFGGRLRIPLEEAPETRDTELTLAACNVRGNDRRLALVNAQHHCPRADQIRRDRGLRR